MENQSEKLTLMVSFGYEKGSRSGKFEGWPAASFERSYSLKNIDTKIASDFVEEYKTLIEKYGFSNSNSKGAIDSHASDKGPDFSF